MLYRRPVGQYKLLRSKHLLRSSINHFNIILFLRGKWHHGFSMTPLNQKTHFNWSYALIMKYIECLYIKQWSYQLKQWLRITENSLKLLIILKHGLVFRWLLFISRHFPTHDSLTIVSATCQKGCLYNFSSVAACDDNHHCNQWLKSRWGHFCVSVSQPQLIIRQWPLDTPY